MTLEENRALLKKKMAEQAAGESFVKNPKDMTLEEKRELLKQRTSMNLAEGPGDSTMDTLGEGVKRAYGMSGSIGHLALGGLTGMQPSLQDAKEAFKGNGKSYSEYMKQRGVPELGRSSTAFPGAFRTDGTWGFDNPQFEKGGPMDITGRGVLGAVGDLGSDLANWTGLPRVKQAIHGLGKYGPLLYDMINPLETLAKGAGKALYKSSPTMKRVDQKNIRFGKDEASDFLLEQGVGGTGRQIEEKTAALAEKIGQKRDAILKEANHGFLDMNRAMQPAEDYVKQLRQSRDPSHRAGADWLEGKIAEYKALNNRPAVVTPGHTTTSLSAAPGTGNNIAGYPQTTITTHHPGTVTPAVRGVTPLEGSAFKSSLYNLTNDATWDSLSKTPEGQKLLKTLAKGLDKETSATVSRTLLSPKKGAQVDLLNDQWGTLLTPRKTLESEAVKDAMRNHFTSVDGLLLAGAELAHSPNALKLFAIKKAADLSKSNFFRTQGGRLLHKTGTMHPDIALREALAEHNNSTQPAQETDWEKLRKGY